MGIDPVSLAITVGLAAANMALTMSRTIEGPRLDSTKFTGGDYNAPLPMTWGTRRLEVPIFWGEELREVKRRRKTKGGKFNEYTYYGTWAVALAGHEVSAISRIWFDTHLVYDLTGEGPVTPFDFGGSFANIGDYIAIYLGTETQEPDPRMQATVEALHGEGSCPAYRGTAYIVFKDIPLEKLGNRIPQVSVEVLTNPDAVWPYAETPIDNGGEQLYFSADFTTLLSGGYDGYSQIDNATRQVFNDIAGNFTGIGNRFATWEDGGYLALTGSDSIVEIDAYGNVLSTLIGSMRDLTTAVDLDGNWHWCAKKRSLDDVYLDGAIVADDISGPKMFCDLDGNTWLFAYSPNTTAHFRQIVGGITVQAFAIAGLSSSGGGAQGVLHYRDDTNDHFVFWWGDTLYAVSPVDGEIITSVSESGIPSFENIRPGTSTVWCGFTERSMADFSEVRTIDPFDTWGLSLDDDQQVIYDPLNHALVEYGATGPRWLFLDRVAPGAVTLGQIESDVAEWLDIADYDFSAHTQEVPGWSATQGQASNIIEPLHNVYDCTIRPHDFNLQGVNYSGVSGGTILTERFVKSEPRYTLTVRQAAELPRAVTITFADMDAEQQPNNVRSDRPLDATGARGEQSLDMSTLALEVDTARGYADRYFRRIWNERREVKLSLTAQQLGLEPGDCRVLDFDGENDIYRLTSLTIKADGVLATEWKYDHPSLALLDGSAGAGFDGRNEAVIQVPLLSRGFVLDIPYLTDSDDQSPPIVYILAGPIADGGWPGATVYQEVGGEYTDEIGSVASSSAVVWGYASDALPDANPNLWDRSSVVTVVLQTGELTGCTEADINANPQRNQALLGDEIVNFTTATLTASLTYELSGFKRGRRGTEWACSTHAERDVFLLLDTAQDVAMELSEVGTDLAFKAITSGRSLGFPVRLEPFSGASLKPYAPCHLEAVKEDNGDWTFSWVRRTRVGGAWTSGSTIPLAEASEEYQLTVGDGVSSDTKPVASATSYVWDVAEQTADTGAEVMAGDLEWSVAQVSDAVGAGFLATA